LKLKINEILKLGLLFTVGSFSALVFYQPRISFTLYLLFFFYLGICVSFYRDKIGKYIYSSKLTVYLAGICWIILFAFKSFKFSQYADGFSEIYTAQFLLVKTCTAIAGLMTLYAAAYRWTLRHNLGNKLTYFGEYCFGIYIVHQFIIYALYRYSIFPLRCNQYLLPWLTTIIVILSSYLISIALKKTILKKII
jgi:peptidoglycan/LPS O-acetylase OafA/YrhL